MTNSTVDASVDGAAPAPKKTRGTGPIRVEAIVPFLILAALVYAYFHFFFDGHLRRAVEYLGTRANGAEVNVAGLETRVWDASLVIDDIQVTDRKHPERNLVQIGTLRFEMLWDALLRGKVVVEHADLLEIQIGSPRAKPGRVLPADPAEKGVTDKLLANMKQQISDSFLGDLAAMAEGADPGAQLSKLGDELKSSARVTELQADLERKEKAWKERLASLPKSETLKAVDERLRKVKLDRFKDVQEIQTSLAELDAIRKEIDGHIKNVQGTGKAVNSDVSAYKAVYGELEQAVKQDIADLQAHFRIPKLDASGFSNALFGGSVLSHVEEARGYMDKARAYMPPERTPEEKAASRPQPHSRDDGYTYAFGRPNAYPRFWLKKAKISSKSSAGQFAGDLTGEITDVTTDPPMIGRPLVVKVAGDFPRQGAFETQLKLIVDHTTDAPMERLDVKVGRYAIAGRPLLKSDAISLGFDKAQGNTAFSAELRGEEVDLRLNNLFTQVGYQVEAKSPVVRDIISGTVNSVPSVTLDARVFGTWKDLNWRLSTNLGDELEKGFRKQIQAKIDEAMARVRGMVEERIAVERKKLMDQYAAAESALKAQIAAKQAEVDKLRAGAEKSKAQLEQQKNQLIKTQQKAIKKEADKLLDGFRNRL